MATTQKDQIIELLTRGDLSTKEIAAQVGVSPGTVSAIKAHMTMGTYKPPTCAGGTDELIETTLETSFGLERDLQDALRANIEQLEVGLRIIDGGKEQTTDAGRIDITAQDERGAVVVIELKAGTAAPAALTQLLSYTVAASERDSGKSVRGVLVAGDFHPQLVLAAKGVPNIALKRYRVRFSFESAEGSR